VKLTDLLFVGVFWAVPLWLVLRAWRRYFVLRSAISTNIFLVRAALALFSISAAAWLLVYGLVIVEDYRKVTNSLLGLFPSPLTLAVVNIPVCAISFALSIFVSTTGQNTARLRSAFMLVSGYMVLIWIFSMTSLH
jgi:hypothetical protein